MQKWIKTLTVLLVAQLVLVLLVNAPKLTSNSQTKDTKLLGSAATSAGKITIEAQGEAPVTLVKQADRWQMPEYFGLAADQAKVTAFLEALAKLERAWPVATTTQAQKRFEVASDKYQRKISLFDNDAATQPSETLYLGTSPGYRKTHARLDRDEKIYSISFSNYEAATTSDNWFDRKLFALDAAQIKTVTAPDITFALKEDKWQVVNLAEDEQSNSKAIGNYVNQVANISVEKALGEAGADTGTNPTHTIILTLASGEPITYSLTLLTSGIGYSLKSSSSPVFFQMAKAQGDALIELQRNTFVEEVTPKPETGETAPEVQEAESTPEEDAPAAD